MIAVLAVVVIVVAAAAVYIVANDNDDDDSEAVINAIARVNTDGSGIYIKSNYNPEDFYSIVDGKVVLNPDAWGGKVWGTPGISSIQHVQFMGLAEEMGLKWLKYEADKKKEADAMYYVESISNYDAAVNKSAEILDGGILWEPQYTMIASDAKYQPLLLTNDLFPGHTCCVIVGATSYMEKNPEVTVAFLAAYVEAVKYINVALANPDGEEYKNLVSICMKYTTGLTEEQIKSALANIVYKFSDDNKTGSLDDLIDDVADLESNLTSMKVITKPITDLGFDNSKQFAEALVNDSYLKDAVSGNVTKADNVNLKITAITGDVHQIGIRIADDLGYFAANGITITVNQVANGGAVALDILYGHSDFALLGAPPMTSNVVNGDFIHA